jgi:hypothetical protein
MNGSPDILEIKNERKPLVGLLLTVIGLAALIVPRVGVGFEDMPWWVSLLFGLACLIPGLIMLVGLNVHRFDRTRKTVTSAWGLVVPFRSTERPTGDFRTVVILKEKNTETRSRTTPNTTVRTERRTFYEYPVKLICEEDPPEADLADLMATGGGVVDTLGNLRQYGVRMLEIEKERKATGRASLTIGKPRNRDKALEMARQVAGFLDLEVCDLGVRE